MILGWAGCVWAGQPGWRSKLLAPRCRTACRRLPYHSLVILCQITSPPAPLLPPSPAPGATPHDVMEDVLQDLTYLTAPLFAAMGIAGAVAGGQDVEGHRHQVMHVLHCLQAPGPLLPLQALPRFPLPQLPAFAPPQAPLLQEAQPHFMQPPQPLRQRLPQPLEQQPLRQPQRQQQQPQHVIDLTLSEDGELPAPRAQPGGEPAAGMLEQMLELNLIGQALTAQQRAVAVQQQALAQALAQWERALVQREQALAQREWALVRWGAAAPAAAAEEPRQHGAG